MELICINIGCIKNTSEKLRKMNKFIFGLSGDRYYIKVNKKRIVSCSGWKVSIFYPFITQSIKQNKENQHKKNNFVFSEVNGMKIAIMFRTSRNIKSMGDIDNILIRTKSLSQEMTYYWFNQIFAHNNVKDYKKKIL